MSGFAREALVASSPGRWIVPSKLGSNASRAHADWAASAWKIHARRNVGRCTTYDQNTDRPHRLVSRRRDEGPVRNIEALLGQLRSRTVTSLGSEPKRPSGKKKSPAGGCGAGEAKSTRRPASRSDAPLHNARRMRPTRARRKSRRVALAACCGGGRSPFPGASHVAARRGSPRSAFSRKKLPLGHRAGYASSVP
jgi:hypothetical protein